MGHRHDIQAVHTLHRPWLANQPIQYFRDDVLRVVQKLFIVFMGFMPFLNSAISGAE